MKNNEVVTKITTSLEVVERRRQHSSHLGLPDTVQVFGKRFQVEMSIFSVSRLSSSSFISQHNNTFESVLNASHPWETRGSSYGGAKVRTHTQHSARKATNSASVSKMQ